MFLSTPRPLKNDRAIVPPAIMFSPRTHNPMAKWIMTSADDKRPTRIDLIRYLADASPLHKREQRHRRDDPSTNVIAIAKI